MKNKKTVSIGSVLPIIGIILCLLKTGGLLTTWSWWVVSAPIWGPAAVFVLIMLFVWAVIGSRTSADALAGKLFEDNDE